ncbi:hypothetical protein [Tsuneonella mangrovi]|uniref:hypothetical protein n=1 Tax=Tsuneonella mangrovi TaxID=1982042 RepID=UPI00123774E5|nr:hypothetical protein [Tsuneonella mangrovi]
MTNFAIAEQALGKLCHGLQLPITGGPLSSLNELRRRLVSSENKRFLALERRIARWSSYRSMRHLLAHATLHCLIDSSGREIVVTRTLPRDKDDVTPDRMWTPEEREELLRQATNDSRSIADQVANIVADASSIARLRTL